MAANTTLQGNIQGTPSNYVQAAYDRMAYFALRPELIFDQLADVKSLAQAMPGSSVTFTIQNDIPAATSTLSATADITTASISSSQVTVSLAEYGNAVTTNAVLRGEAFVEIDPIVANVVGYNAGISIDGIARAALATNTQWRVPAASTASVGTTVALTQANVAALTTNATATYKDTLQFQKNLRSLNVAPFGNYYAAVIHPDVAFDIQTQSVTNSGGNYLAPHQYAQPAEIWAGELGALNGFRFIESPRAPVQYGDNQTAVTATTQLTSGSSITSITLGSAVTLGSGAVVSVTSGTNSQNFTLSTNANNTTTLTVTSLTANATYPVGSAVAVVSSGTGAYSPVYTTFLMGRQALAKAHSIVDGNGAYPKMVPGPVTDTLRRFVPMGWYWLGGYQPFRTAASIQYFTQSSITNIDPTIDNN